MARTELPRLVAFDLDDTLAPSKSPVDPAMLQVFARLLDRTLVAVISGGNFAQFQAQLLDRLDVYQGVSDESLTRLHLLPTCGTRYERHTPDGWATVYSELLSTSEREDALRALREEAERLDLWEPARAGAEVWGDVLEDRGSQVTFSALGQRAPVAVKHLWDPDGSKKNALRAAVAARLPNLEVRSGGSTSVDITRRGIDKAYGMRKLEEHTGIPLSEMLFVGDRLDPEGNDYPVKELGVACHEVTGWEDTVAFLEELLGATE